MLQRSALDGGTPAIEVVTAASWEGAERLRDAGFCPVECAYGSVSVVDALVMDHHGDLAHLAPVAARAWYEHHGARRDDPRFVAAAPLDADAAFAIAALAGIVPGPEDAGAERVAALVDLIALLDTDPIGRDITAHPAGGLLRLWSALAAPRGPAGNLAGVHAWHPLCVRSEQALAPYVATAREQETARREVAAAQGRRFQLPLATDERLLVLDGATIWGFDLWYGRRPEAGPQDPDGWDHPVVCSRDGNGRITVGCPNEAVAGALFGPGGLAVVYPWLEPPGWGGRAAVGGSPRGYRTTQQDLRAAAERISAVLSERDRHTAAVQAPSAQPDPRQRGRDG